MSTSLIRKDAIRLENPNGLLNVHSDLESRTTAGAIAAELLASSMRLLPEALFLTETRAGMQTAIFANEIFVLFSRCSMTKVMEHDLRFLQGPQTDPSAFTGFLQPHKAEQISGQEMMRDKKDATPFAGKVSAPIFADNCVHMHHEIDARVHGPAVSNFVKKPFSAKALVPELAGFCRKQPAYNVQSR